MLDKFIAFAETNDKTQVPGSGMTTESSIRLNKLPADLAAKQRYTHDIANALSRIGRVASVLEHSSTDPVVIEMVQSLRNTEAELRPVVDFVLKVIRTE